MNEVTLISDSDRASTILSNVFIDEFMAGLNEAQIKLYIYLVRTSGCLSSISVAHLADRFDYTEKDTVKALLFLDKKGLLQISFNSSRKLTGIRILSLKNALSGNEADITDAVLDNYPGEKRVIMSEIKDKEESLKEDKVIEFANKPSYSADEIAAFKARPEIVQLLFAAETYLSKTLSSRDIASILYMYDSLSFDADLIEYLIEYCVGNKKTGFRYIETVALSWAKDGIDSVEKAKERCNECPGEVYDVLKAFGINTGRKPSAMEKEFVRKWTSDYGFDMDMIKESIRRTVDKTHSASFEYADSILYRWKSNKAKDLKDVERLDREHQDSKTDRKQPVKNKFNDFPQRQYDYDELEKIMLSN